MWGELTAVVTGQDDVRPGTEVLDVGGELMLWSDTLRPLASFRLTDRFAWFHSVDLSADGRRLVAGTQDGRVLVWNLDALGR